MAQDFNEWMQSFKSKIDISEIIGSYVTLEQKGSRKWACCPFHYEKTPSFCIYEQEQSYYCYGCHKGGDSIKFVMEIENTDFIGAVRILADKYNMAVPEFYSNDKNKETKQKKDKMYEMLKLTANYYYENLMGASGAEAREYLANRGITLDTIKTFGFGLSLGFNELVDFLKSKGYNEILMQEAGLTDFKNTRYFDAMAGRVVVPVINNLKQVIAFGGRVIQKDKLPKYKNTKETIIFDKSCELYGQHTIKKLKLEEPITSIIIVEGYMDVISLHQAGIKNAMASMGTALTLQQAKLLHRYLDSKSKKVYICYDGDSAGKKATLRGLDILLDANLDVRVISLPNGADPDDYIKQFGKVGFEKLMLEALPLYEYKLEILSKDFDLISADGRGNYAIEAMKILRSMNSPALVDVYMPIVEKHSNIKKDILYSQFNQTEIAKPLNIRVKQEIELSNTSLDKAIRYALFIAFGGVENLQIQEDLTQYISDKNQLSLYNIVRESWGNTNLTQSELMAYEDTNPEVKAIIQEGAKIGEDISKKYLEDCCVLIKREGLYKKKKMLIDAIDNEKDDTIKIMLLSQLAQLNSKR